MFTLKAEHDVYLIHLFASEGSEHAYQDRWLIQPSFPNSLRVAVIDGVTPWRTEPCPGGDAAQFAASALMSALSLPVTIEEAFSSANRALHNPVLSTYRGQAMAAAAAVDISYEMGWLDCSGLVAADCDWWVTENGSPLMHLFVGGEARTEEAIRLAEERAAVDPIADTFDALRERESQDYSDDSSMHRHAVGRCPKPRFGMGEGRFSSIALASDGARLAEAPKVTADPDAMWSWLSRVESANPRDDFTVLTVTLG